jgi:hypothetical protein
MNVYLPKTRLLIILGIRQNLFANTLVEQGKILRPVLRESGKRSNVLFGLPRHYFPPFMNSRNAPTPSPTSHD